MPSRGASPPAVVVGLCSHGLSTVRALHSQGVAVHALESNRALPGARTRQARVHWVGEINGPDLLSGLKTVRPAIDSGEPPVLYLMNDNMVREVALRWPEIEGQYRLSWADSRTSVLRLLQKSELQTRCREVGLQYSPAEVLFDEQQIEAVCCHLRAPFVVKPVKPLSRFKVELLSSAAELHQLVQAYGSELPFLVQQWVAGGDQDLIFCAFYFDRGQVLARFVGRKVRSCPPALGQTTVAIPAPDARAVAAAERFFEGLELSGPASLELKRDADGTLWVIEPTVGRTDFWLECCSANGVNLPFVEYCHATGRTLPASKQSRHRIWMDTEREPRALFWYLLSPRGWPRLRLLIAFPYLRLGDLRPFLSATRARVGRFPGKVARRLLRLFRPPPVSNPRGESWHPSRH